MSEYRAYLASSLNRLFDELDARWPSRDRGGDGWYNPDRVSVGHNRGHNGLVHAIDFRPGGVSMQEIVANIYKGGSVLRYFIWNRELYHARNNFQPEPYNGDSPHTDHMHVEINQTTSAESYPGSWGIHSRVEEDLLSDERKWLRDMHFALTSIAAPGVNGNVHAGVALETLLTEQQALRSQFATLHSSLVDLVSGIGKLDPVAFANALAASPAALAALTSAMRDQLPLIPTAQEVAKAVLVWISAGVHAGTTE